MRAAVIVLCCLLVGSSIGLAQTSRPGVPLRDVDGRVLTPFAPTGQASLVFFVATDCPVSNSYAPVIQRVCRDYAPRGVGCSLIYEDVDTHPVPAHLDEQVRQHLKEYGYAGVPAIVDRERAAANYAQATITPQAFLIDRSGKIRYRGRIDNLYAAFGKTRQRVTSHDLRDDLDAVLDGRKVLHRETEALGCFITDPALLRKHDHE
jgi:thiol-disulfide isomerase/thioredoxin